MPSPKATIAVRPGRAEAGDIVYASATTQVFRLATQSDRRVYKRYLGHEAKRRLALEKDVLLRLAGVEGVVRLAPGTSPPDVLALEDFAGAPLSQTLRAGPCDVPTVMSAAIRLARILAEVHRAGIIHRDINPANILMSPQGEPVLIDFDLAVPSDREVTLAADAPILGTLGYLAPEQTGRTGRAVDERADLYALGATLYEMATGRRAFDATDPLQLIHDHLVREPPPAWLADPRVPRGLASIIERLLAKAPELRYQSAAGLLHDLLRLRDELAAGREGRFELGERDFKSRLTAPSGLVGRDAELARLKAALNDALLATRTVLVEGPAGVGKSALCEELRPWVAAAGGWLVRGKFDQYQKEASVNGALLQALRALGRLLLALPRDELETQRRRILERLGRRAGLITRLSQEFALLLDVEPEVPTVDPRQAVVRLQQASVDLLGAIVSPVHPLVIVLDDLQWAEGLSLRIFERLMSEPSLRGLLLVGAYRTVEAADFLLSPMLKAWRERHDPPVHITLANLPPAALGELIGRMLRLQPARAGELSLAVGALTDGNPFDTVVMINALRSEGVLTLGESGWQWDEAKVRRFVGRGNVMDLLAARLAGLPAASRELLESMSCLGSPVECSLLGAATGLNEEVRERLRPALDDGLLVADDSSGQHLVHFRHDRVQQAVRRSLEDARRDRLQLSMARRLAGRNGFDREAAQLYLACSTALLAQDNPQEQRSAALLFFAMAQSLARGATYQLAERYLAAAGALLGAVNDPTDAARRTAIDVGRHAALYSLGRLDEADALYQAMQAGTAEAQDLVEPTCLQMRSLDMRSRMDSAMNLGLALLSQLGLDVPTDYQAADTERRLDALKAWIARDALVDHATRTQIRERRPLAIAKLLNRTARSANYLVDKSAFVWLLLQSQRLWARHGPCAELVACLCRMSYMFVSVRQDYRSCFDSARHFLTVGEALDYEPHTSEARYTFAGTASPWFEPLESALQQAMLAFEGVKASGDISYACYVHRTLIVLQMDVAASLDTVGAELETGIALCQRSGNLHAAALHMCMRQLLRALRGQTRARASFDDEEFDEAAFAARLANVPYMGHTYPLRRALCALLFGDLPALVANAARAMALLETIPGYYTAVHVHLFRALARAWELQRDDPPCRDRADAWAELDSCRAWFAARAADQPYNFRHLLRLVEAEQAWARGDKWQAAAAFDAALVEAGSRERPWQRALIAERAGLLHLAAGLEHTGRKLLRDACEQYGHWGAIAKVEQMCGTHPFLREGRNSQVPRPLAGDGQAPPAGATVSVSSESLDLMGVLQASQALSRETSLERLNNKVTEVLAALSGATHVLLLSWHDDQWWLLTPPPGDSALQLAQAAERGLLPLSVVRYAERTQQPLLLDEVIGDDRFARDPYFAGLVDYSLLVVPITSQGAMRAMLLLENRLGRAAFNAQRLDAVMLIAGQLAVSIANAQLYERLEQRVSSRTRELEQAQAELVATARRAGKAEIANNVLHNVGNVLNSVNVSAVVLRRVLRESHAQGLARAVDLMKEHEHELGRFMESDSRGQALLAYLGEFVGALAQERVNALLELERLTRSVEHINYVVATQQSHAGPSSVVESARPQDLLEEALRLSADALARRSVCVVRNYAQVPAAALDRQRVLQILINLIGNAAQAMEGMPETARELKLTTALTRDASGEQLRISVQDCGEGIAHENLTRIFAHGFTTRKHGHGFGLHSSALAAMEMGGRLAVQSDGPGRGSVFTLELPLKQG